MATNNSENNQYTNESDGFDISGGSTARKLTVTGSDITLTGSGSNVYTFPSSTSTLASLALSETLTNKTIDGSSNTITNVSLSTGVTGNLSVTNLDSGTGASSSTFWRGDGTWASSATGSVTSVAVSGANGIGVSGSPITSSGTISLSLGTITGTTWNGTKIGLAYGGTNADLSATGGTSRVLKQTTSGGNITVGQLAASDLSNGTSGSGSVVLATSPALVTPTLGVASVTSVNKVAITAPATSATLTIANGKTLTASNSLTLAGTDSTTMTFPSTSATIARTDSGQTFTGTQTFSSAPTFSSISNTGTLTLPTSTDTLVGRDTTDTLTNKDLSSSTNTFPSNYKVGTFTCPSSTGNSSVTGIGFQPKLVQFFSTFTSGTTGQMASSEGAADSAGHQWSKYNSTRAISSSNVAGGSGFATDKCIYFRTVNGSGGVVDSALASYVSMDSDGFTINFSLTNAAYSVMWIAIG